MIDSLYLAWRYVRFYKLKTAILISSITLMMFLPAGIAALVEQTAAELRRRASTTPLLIGARGSETDLVLNSLYFESEPPTSTTMAELERVRYSGLAKAIPLYVKFEAKGKPIVGTTIEYFTFRKLDVAAGRPFAMLGECVLGAQVAEELAHKPGETLITTPGNFLDLAGVYPLKMRVVGVLKPSGTPDDGAIFVDVKTCWIIAGLGHGHQDLAKPGAEAALLNKEEGRLTANASVRTYTEITPENASSFHFHGDRATFPITAVLALPPDAKSRTLLLGRYVGDEGSTQAVEPSAVMEDLLSTILRVRTFLIAGSLLLGVATSLAVVLVFLLSLRLRRAEIETILKIGGSRLRLAAILAWEILLVIALSSAVAGCLTLLASRFSETVIRGFLL